MENQCSAYQTKHENQENVKYTMTENCYFEFGQTSPEKYTYICLFMNMYITHAQ